VGELRINARSVRERDLYRTHFGHHVFGDPHFFPGDEKYSLDPLLRRGELVLTCVDVPGREWLRRRGFILTAEQREEAAHGTLASA